MKTLTINLSILVLLTSFAYAQEYDDMYFTKKDRQEIQKKQQLENERNQQRNEMQRRQEVAAQTDARAAYNEEFSWDTNPDFIQRYETYVEESEENTDYYVEEEDRPITLDGDAVQQNADVLSPYNSNFYRNRSINSWNRFRVQSMMGMSPFMFNSFNGFGMYDPFYDPFFYGNRFMDPWNNPAFMWNSWNTGAWGGFYDPFFSPFNSFYGYGFNNMAFMPGFNSNMMMWSNTWRPGFGFGFGGGFGGSFWNPYFGFGNNMMIVSDNVNNRRNYIEGQSPNRSTTVPVASQERNDRRYANPDSYNYRSSRSAETSREPATRRASSTNYRRATPTQRSATYTRPSSSSRTTSRYSSGRDFSNVQRRATSTQYSNTRTTGSSSYYRSSSSTGRSSSGYDRSSYNTRSSSSSSYSRSSGSSGSSRSSSSSGSKSSSSRSSRGNR